MPAPNADASVDTTKSLFQVAADAMEDDVALDIELCIKK
jgi:hypothetical protein